MVGIFTMSYCGSKLIKHYRPNSIWLDYSIGSESETSFFNTLNNLSHAPYSLIRSL